MDWFLTLAGLIPDMCPLMPGYRANRKARTIAWNSNNVADGLWRKVHSAKEKARLPNTTGHFVIGRKKLNFHPIVSEINCS